MTGKNSLIKEVESFWNSNICGAKFIDKPFCTKEFFDAYANFRYTTEWHLNELVPFNDFYNKRVLEIGCGMGCDGRRFAENGAIYTGIDLTDAAVNVCKIHFKLYNLGGKFYKENVENLSFSNNTFDLVYAHGVLHHTENIERAIKEIFRVLKERGKIIIMLYHKNSLNYYIRIMVMMRLALLLYILLRPVLPKKFRRGYWEQHYINYSKEGKQYFRAKEFLNHCTDGPLCPIAKAFTKRECREMFKSFENLHFKVAHFPLRKYLSFIPKSFERFFAKQFGWYLFIYGNKPVVEKEIT